MTVLPSEVRIDGAFVELAGAGSALAAEIRGRRVSVTEIYAIASALERLYHEAGYPLVRVAVPPQHLVDGGALRLLVVDGFIEAINVDAVPARVRPVVAARTAGLIGRRHLRLAELERALLVAGDLPGLALRSTLMRGDREGGAKLILDGAHRLVSASAGADNRLPASVGTWQLRGTMAVNSALGLGEQAYGSVGLGANIEAAAQGQAPLAVYGGGLVVPVGVDGVTVNPEYTHSTTRTPQAAGVVGSLGTFDRVAVRLRTPVSLTRASSIYANASIEYIDQQIGAPAFGVMLSHDRYAVARFGSDYAATLPWGAGIQAGVTFSGGLGGRDLADAASSGVPLSRLGASPEFTKLTGSFHLAQPLPWGARWDLIGAGQSSFGKPMLRSEQISLDGADAVSAFASGTLTADQGVTLRSELSRSFRLDAAGATLSPYVFGAAGRGWLANATVIERSTFSAGSVGAGLRSATDGIGVLPGASLGLEAARGFTDLPGARLGWRANVIASMAY
ncbi:ShlB/FhaC/HecB family hemolysin secretion/activation protein [Bradyrhizobium sp. U531]|uniref:ShlB/FhaC/HecB family hemolysin secretion/activation protein n=1 Tax=Bradyrhizobium sp. U531 TaxID=3053458 RepID=UPI003F42DA49